MENGESCKPPLGGDQVRMSNTALVLAAPYEYLHRQPGKNVRSRLILAFNQWLDVAPEILHAILQFIDTLHTASLLIDDIEDESEIRRGVPVAHRIYGTAHTINAANYMYFKALRELSVLQSSTCMEICLEELLNLHRGQGMDIFWRETMQCPTEDEYLAMVQDKTGGLFRLAIRLLQSESSNPIDCVPLVNLIGTMFQIVDDCLNITQYSSQKGFCDDISEGKFSLPIIASIQADPSNPLLWSILKQRTQDDGIKSIAVDYVRSVDGLKYSQRRAAELKTRATELLEEMQSQLGEAGKDGTDCIRAILDALDVGV